MKLVKISFRFEYNEAITEMLDELEVSDYVRYPMVQGKTCDGKHFGSQVFPGNISVIQALLTEKQLKQLCSRLKEFRAAKAAHKHLRAVVIPLEQVI